MRCHGKTVGYVQLDLDVDKSKHVMVVSDQRTDPLASLNALFNISSAPGPMISESKDEVVFRT